LILPPGKIYEPFFDQMRSWALETRNTPHEDVSITSFDGLRLTGKYYEYAPGAPIELMFHGYRGNAERDLSGGLHRCFQLGHSALIVDQRCSGTSEGSVITFGIHEHRDCLSWINFMLEHFGTDIRIILTGISMGASTVLIASGTDLPKNVIGILADCGFHSAKDVICSVARSMHLPYKILYPFVKFAAFFFGHFDLEEMTAVEAVKNSKVPILFFHGLADDYVPCYMSQLNYEACVSRKKLVLIPGAGHGLSFPVAPEKYLDEMRSFFYAED
jgi:fermentation-respiration switch protein FrsA (DUF1100 family)